MSVRARVIVEGAFAGLHRNPHAGVVDRVLGAQGVRARRRHPPHRLEGGRPRRPLLPQAVRGRDGDAHVPAARLVGVDGLRAQAGRPSWRTPAIWRRRWPICWRSRGTRPACWCSTPRRGSTCRPAPAAGTCAMCWWRWTPSPGGAHRAGARAGLRRRAGRSQEPGRALLGSAGRAGRARRPAAAAALARPRRGAVPNPRPRRGRAAVRRGDRLRGDGARRRPPAAGRPARSGGLVQARVGGAARTLAAHLHRGARGVPVRDDRPSAGRRPAGVSVRAAAGAGSSDAFSRTVAAAGPAGRRLAGDDPPHRPAARPTGSVRGDGAVDARRSRGRRPPQAA